MPRLPLIWLLSTLTFKPLKVSFWPSALTPTFKPETRYFSYKILPTFNLPSNNKFLSAVKSAGLLLALLSDFAALLFGSNLFKSNLSAFKLNLILGFLKLATFTSPTSLVSAMAKLNLLLTSSFLISALALKLKLPLMLPLGRLGSFTCNLPTNFGISKIMF